MTSRMCSRCTPATETWAISASASSIASSWRWTTRASPTTRPFAAMTAYMRWAVDNVLVYSPIGAVVPPELRMPRWDWDGLQT